MGLLLLGSSCELRKKMYDQPKFESYEITQFFNDSRSARPTIEGTVARGQLKENEPFYTGRDAEGNFLKDLPEPLELTQALLDRGQERFDIHCSVCHGYSGYGDGFVVRRGYKQPTSYHDPRLRESDLGYFYSVISQGFGMMASYSYQVKPEDRWAIAAYIRALQLSQQAPAEAIAAATATGEEGGGH